MTDQLIETTDSSNTSLADSRHTRTFDVFNDPGHGWAKVSLALLDELGIAGKISRCSYQRKEYAYLEEDCDLTLFINTMKELGITVKFRDHYSNKQSKIQGYWPYCPRIPRLEDTVEQVSAARVAVGLEAL